MVIRWFPHLGGRGRKEGGNGHDYMQLLNCWDFLRTGAVFGRTTTRVPGGSADATASESSLDVLKATQSLKKNPLDFKLDVFPNVK